MKKIKWHLIGLLFYSFWVVGLDYIFLGMEFSFTLEFEVLLEEYWIFYTGYAFLYLLFLAPANKKLYSIPAIILSLIGTYIFTLLYYFISDTFYKKIDFSQSEIIYSVTQFFTHYFIFSVGYFFVVKLFIYQKKIKEVEQQALILQKNLLQSENNFLRAQINPHFLYNCLNFLYSKTFKQQPEVAEGIMMLSQIMRYSLADFSGTNGLANLADEIEHIENLIKINEFRFDNMLQIKFYLEGDATGKEIAPMLLMTLVENVFKHGDLQDIAYAATLTCNIDDLSKTIQFITSNKKNKAQSNSSQGVGLTNIKQRLQLLYNDNFKLVEIEEPAVFRVELIMPYFD